jgi:acyl-CoA thioesterase
MIEKEQYDSYEQSNHFMSYNHIKVCECSPEGSTLKAEITEEMKNIYGIIHGGMLFTMADCAAGITARADGGKYVTLSSNVNFIRNVSAGTLYAKAEPIKRGRSIAIYHVAVTDGEGNLLLDGVMNMFRKQD